MISPLNAFSICWKCPHCETIGKLEYLMHHMMRDIMLSILTWLPLSICTSKIQQRESPTHLFLCLIQSVYSSYHQAIWNDWLAIPSLILICSHAFHRCLRWIPYNRKAITEHCIWIQAVHSVVCNKIHNTGFKHIIKKSYCIINIHTWMEL